MYSDPLLGEVREALIEMFLRRLRPGGWFSTWLFGPPVGSAYLRHYRVSTEGRELLEQWRITAFDLHPLPTTFTIPDQRLPDRRTWAEPRFSFTLPDCTDGGTYTHDYGHLHASCIRYRAVRERGKVQICWDQMVWQS